MGAVNAARCPKNGVTGLTMTVMAALMKTAYSTATTHRLRAHKMERRSA